MKRRYPRDVDYYDDDHQQREGVALERNGALTLVEDRETGEEVWKDDWEIER
jgi:general stress protein 26